MKESISMHIPLVILPMDSFTGKPILSPDVLVWAGEAKHPIVKPEGYRVFLEKLDGKISVMLWGRQYQRMKWNLDLSALKANNPVAVIYMLPNKSYLFPAGTVYMEGKLPKHTALNVAGDTEKGIQKLGMDCEAGADRLFLYSKTQENLAGRMYFLQDKKEGAHRNEWVKLQEAAEDKENVYYLKNQMNTAHARIGTRLLPAVHYEADVFGTDYFLAVPIDDKEKEVSLYCQFQAEGQTEEHTFLIKKGETLRWDF